MSGLKVNKLDLCNIINKYIGLNKVDAMDLMLTEESLIHYKAVYQGNIKPFEKHYFLSAASKIVNTYKKSNLKITLDLGDNDGEI